MITEDYISFDIAKLLKEKGFDEATNRYYNAQYNQIRTVSDTFMWHWNDEEFMKSVLMEGAIAIPTLQMAMKWLRNTYNLFINVDWDSENFYFVIITDMIKRDYVKADISGNEYRSYEDACEAAIKYCLENLI